MFNTPANPLEELTAALTKLPGIGEKTAMRMAYFIHKSTPDYAAGLANAIIRLKREMKTCTLCHNLSAEPLCDICKSPKRDASIVCVVEDPRDISTIEKTGQLNCRYHVLNGLLSPINGIIPDKLEINSLVTRVKGGDVKELIFALNHTVEGDATTLYISTLLKGIPVKLTKLASGIPSGTNIEYLDPITLKLALSARVNYEL